MLDNDEALKKFHKDLARRFRKLTKFRSVENYSKFLNYLRNCPDSYTKYHK